MKKMVRFSGLLCVCSHPRRPCRVYGDTAQGDLFPVEEVTSTRESDNAWKNDATLGMIIDPMETVRGYDR